MSKKYKFQLPMAFVVMVLSFTICWQIKGVHNAAGETEISSRIDTLQSELKSAMDKSEALSEENSELKSQIENYRQQLSAQEQNSDELLRSDLVRAEMFAGLTDVEGSGIIVELKDASNVQSGVVDGFVMDKNFGIVHDDQLLMFLNELRASGAEALSLNDERIIATSEIRCAGPTVSVNNTKCAAPFVIRAIGDPDTLESALRISGGAIDQVGLYGIEVTVKRDDKVKIGRYTGATSFKYASAAEEAEQK